MDGAPNPAAGRSLDGPNTALPLVVMVLAVTTVVLTVIRRRRRAAGPLLKMEAVEDTAAGKECTAAAVDPAAVIKPGEETLADDGDAATTCTTATEQASGAPAGVPTVFFDLDGTLVSTEMQHAIYYFINGLPARHQVRRAWHASGIIPAFPHGIILTTHIILALPHHAPRPYVNL